MCADDNGPNIWASTNIPKPNDAATIIKLGLGKFSVTMAQPQHNNTNKCIAINSVIITNKQTNNESKIDYSVPARQALMNLLSMSSQMMSFTLPKSTSSVGTFRSDMRPADSL